MAHKFKYDVAFSFIQEDETLATAINDLIQERVSTFLYSKRQEEIAGTDGEKTFNSVFETEARIVVVLYRDRWGTTPWTRIEQTAIKNRAYDEGYDGFAIFIPVVKSATLPPWLPKTQIWVDLERWGVNGAASVIEARVQQAGGSPRVESVTERAARLKRQMEAQTARKQFLDSIDGVNKAHEEVRNLFQCIEDIVKTVAEDAGLVLKTERGDRWLDVGGHLFCLGIDWQCSFKNSLQGSSLRVSLWRGPPVRPGRIFAFDQPERLGEERYEFDRDSTERLGWRKSKSEFLSGQGLAEVCVKVLMDQIHKQHSTNHR